jgi:hypothetical protein
MRARRPGFVLVLAGFICSFGLIVPRVAADLAPPAAVSPTPGATVGIEAALSWTAVSGAQAYRVEYGQDPTFAQVTTADTVSLTYLPPFLLDTGTTYWRVAALSSGTPGAWTSSSFTATRTDAVTPNSPADGFTFEFPDDPPVLTWSRGLGGPYQIELSGPDGTDTLTAMDYSLVFTWNSVPGSYSWRVRAGSGLAVGPWSALRSFSVTWPSSTPAILSPPDGASVEMPVLDWSPVSGASKYELQVSADPGFPTGSTNDIVTQATEYQLAWEVSAPELEYWRVRAQTGSSVQVISGPWTGTRSVTVSPLVARPEDLWPANGSTFTVPPTLRWSPLDGAVRYRVETAADPADLDGIPGSQPCLLGTNGASFVQPTASLSCLQTPASGIVYWRVQATDLRGSPTLSLITGISPELITESPQV